MNQGPHEVALRPRRRSGTARVYVCGQIPLLAAAQEPRPAPLSTRCSSVLTHARRSSPTPGNRQRQPCAQYAPASAAPARVEHQGEDATCRVVGRFSHTPAVEPLRLSRALQSAGTPPAQAKVGTLTGDAPRTRMRTMSDHRSLSEPAPFTADDFAERLRRAAHAAQDAGLDGILVTPGPDLLYLTGYAPVAITERITMLVIPVDAEPAMIVPRLERPDAEAAAGASSLRITDWTDGSDPYTESATLMAGTGRYAVSDSAWAMHLLGLQDRLPKSSYVSMTAALPMLRAIKDDDEIERLAAAGAAADQAYEEIVTVRFAGRSEADIGSDLADLLRQFGHSQVDFTVVGSGPNGANPHHEIGPRIIEDGDMVVLDFGGLKHGYGSDTTRTVHVGEPTAEEREVHDVVRHAQQAGFEAVAARRRVPGDRSRVPGGDH